MEAMNTMCECQKQRRPAAIGPHARFAECFQFSQTCFEKKETLICLPVKMKESKKKTKKNLPNCQGCEPKLSKHARKHARARIQTHTQIHTDTQAGPQSSAFPRQPVSTSESRSYGNNRYLTEEDD